MIESVKSLNTDGFLNREKTGGRIRQKNEAAIIAAAELEFSLHGFKGASIKAIAERASLPKSNILYYFQSKIGLYGAVLGGVMSQWNMAFNDIHPDMDPKIAIEAYIKAKIEHSRTNPLASKIFAMEIIQGGPYLSKYLAQNMRVWADSKAKVIRAWAAKGKMDLVDPYHLLFMIWSTTQHYADFNTQLCWVLNKGDLEEQDYDVAIETCCSIITKGLGIKS